ncbi:hypothetical protein BCR33DRAFT_770788 [Rhizoclosmatium globosum]|uniref:Uncharacterized protein n=1 Tax=Rhizoclosmatium globosum TaxID=329046 RepID=A0A1Y2BIC1_9FUNG|nr:hypothetical protein BCR33DRAFT_770788 [Rhizoclosmatium globosum]|eukprot:ORY34538.1 hypothetical protein BCR33DRAFT_770788 [Rhizoclosmatium globosum]
MECISQAIVDLNPSILNLKGFIGHEVVKKLSMCTHLRYLTIEYDDSEAFVGSINLNEVALGLVCIPNLRELSLISSHQLQLEVMKIAGRKLQIVLKRFRSAHFILTVIRKKKLN